MPQCRFSNAAARGEGPEDTRSLSQGSRGTLNVGARPPEAFTERQHLLWSVSVRMPPGVGQCSKALSRFCMAVVNFLLARSCQLFTGTACRVDLTTRRLSEPVGVLCIA